MCTDMMLPTYKVPADLLLVALAALQTAWAEAHLQVFLWRLVSDCDLGAGGFAFGVANLFGFVFGSA